MLALLVYKHRTTIILPNKDIAFYVTGEKPPDKSPPLKS